MRRNNPRTNSISFFDSNVQKYLKISFSLGLLLKKVLLCLHYWTGTSPELVGLRPACGVGVQDFVQERFHSTNPGDFENTFIKAGNSETKEGLRVQEVIGERLGGALFWLPRKVTGKE